MALVISEEKRAKLHQQVDKFLVSTSTSRTDITVLSEYLGYNPKTSPVQGLFPLTRWKSTLILPARYKPRDGEIYVKVIVLNEEPSGSDGALYYHGSPDQ
jgi:hypothetical protein